MRRTWSLVVIAGLLATGCKGDQPSPDTGMGAGAGVDTMSRTEAPPPVQVDSAPWDPDPAGLDTTLPRPSTTTPAKKDTTDSTRQRSSRPATPPAETTVVASAAPARDTTPSPSADAPLRDAYHTAPVDTVDAKTYQGWKYYNLNCARCHGEDVAGTTIAPHLITSMKPDGAIPTKELFIQTVCEGRVPKGMPAWCQTGMTPAEIDTIYAYVKGRSDAKLHPGRPARRDS